LQSSFFVALTRTRPGARAMLPIDEVADVLVCFHSQQAVEKALKAVLAARGVEFPFIHDI
jgi:HEPN domain